MIIFSPTSVHSDLSTPYFLPFILFTRSNIWFMVSTLLFVKEKGELVNGRK